MGTASRSNIARHLQTNLILFCVGAVGACTLSVTQPWYLEVDYTHEAVTIKCTFSATGCPSEQPTCLWFRYGAHQPENLCLDGCKKIKLLSKELRSFLTALVSLLSVYVTGVCVAFILLSK
ncbi:IGSF6 isoform 3, partial [Pan troglodytes]